MDKLAVGMRAPDFSALDQHGTRHTLGSLLERGRLVLYFYPKDFTAVCTAQACTFRDAARELAERGVHVVGVSSDPVESHRGFAEKHGLPFPLLADPNFELCDAYGGRYPLFNRARRITYVIDTNRTILAVFRHELSARKHLTAVLAAISS
jgi:peroxiredoxin Q/BCP